MSPIRKLGSHVVALDGSSLVVSAGREGFTDDPGGPSVLVLVERRRTREQARIATSAYRYHQISLPAGVRVARTNLFRVANHYCHSTCFSHSRRIRLPEPDRPRVWRAPHPPPRW